MTLEQRGSCLCGETHLRVTVDNTHISACHCSMCRKWTGGPMLVVHCSQPPLIEGRAPSVYDSSDWAQRGFCSRCGTHLYYRLKANDFYAVPVVCSTATRPGRSTCRSSSSRNRPGTALPTRPRS